MFDTNHKGGIQQKGFICVLAILLLLILLMARIQGLTKDNRQVGNARPPVVKELKNVWIEDVGIAELKFFYGGNTFTYRGTQEVIRQENGQQLADLTLEDDIITTVHKKTDRLHGKVLSVGEEYVEVEGYGKLGLSKDYRGYRIYDTLRMVTKEDLRIGYDLADFVLEDGCVCGILLARQEDMEAIRVLIRTDGYEQIYHSHLEITGSTDYTVCYVKEGIPCQEQYKAGEVWSLNAGDPKLNGSVGRIRIQPKALTGKLGVKNITRQQGIPWYRGCLEIAAEQEGLVLMNDLPMEEYLYSVVPSEMPSDYPGAALQAQAVCARTYAYGKLHNPGYPQLGAHLDDSTAFQVYNNIPETPQAMEAVKATYGKILMNGDEIAQTYYYSTSCGVGADVTVWKGNHGSAQEYLQSRKIAAQSREQMPQTEYFLTMTDPQDYDYTGKWYRWTYEVKKLDVKAFAERLAGILQIEEPSIKVIRDICVEKRGPGFILDQLKIETDAGTFLVEGENKIRQILCDGKTMALCRDGSENLCRELLPSAFFLLETSTEGESVVGYRLVGGGYGHGVGMSQNAAGEMAKQGMSFEDILEFFYQGCHLKCVY